MTFVFLAGGFWTLDLGRVCFFVFVGVFDGGEGVRDLLGEGDGDLDEKIESDEDSPELE